MTPPAPRAARFGMLGVAFGAGFVLGPALGGLAGAVDPRLPFWIAGALSLVNTLYGVLVLPESLPPERRAPFSWRRANPLGSFALLRSRPQLLGLAGVNFLGHLAHASLPNIGVLYMMYRYGWDSAPSASPWRGRRVRHGGPGHHPHGRPLASGALRRAFSASRLCGVRIGGDRTRVLGRIPLLALWGLASPAALGLMSHMVGPTEQGQLQGANASIMGIANLLGPGLFAQILAYSIASERWHMPGAAFLLAALILALSMMLAWWITQESR